MSRKATRAPGDNYPAENKIKKTRPPVGTACYACHVLRDKEDACGCSVFIILVESIVKGREGGLTRPERADLGTHARTKARASKENIYRVPQQGRLLITKTQTCIRGTWCVWWMCGHSRRTF